MLTAKEIEDTLRALQPYLAEQFSVKRIGYFGSYMEQTQSEASDLDIVVEFSHPIGWKFFTLEKLLEEKFGLKIDLVTSNALISQLHERILSQVVYI